MAIIFQKSATDQCLILGSRESLTYPFNLGQWSQIRIGGFFSYTNVTSGNGTGIFEAFYPSSMSSFVQQVFWGIKTTGDNPPYTANTFFIGVTNNSNQTKSELKNTAPAGICAGGQSDNNPNGAFSIVSGTSKYGEVAFGAGNPGIWAPTSSLVTGTTSYAMFNGITYAYDQSRNIISGAAFRDEDDSLATSNVSIANLQSKMQDTSNRKSYSTGYCDPSIAPNAIYIYNPLINNSIRIHSLMVDKYA